LPELSTPTAGPRLGQKRAEPGSLECLSRKVSLSTRVDSIHEETAIERVHGKMLSQIALGPLGAPDELRRDLEQQAEFVRATGLRCSIDFPIRRDRNGATGIRSVRSPCKGMEHTIVPVSSRKT
jgi:hypothetical protein